MIMDDLREGLFFQQVKGTRYFTVLMLLGGCAVLGCSGSSTGVPVPDFDAVASANTVIEQYDTNGDFLLDAEEIQKCAALASSAKQLDSSGDGQVSSEEIADRLLSFSSEGMGIVKVACRIFMDKRQLGGAKIILQPADFLGESIAPASGTSVAEGICGLTVDPAVLPKELSRVRGVQPGFYKVLITHSGIEIPERYNKKTTLGVEVSQKLIGDRGIRFDLTTKDLATK